MHILLAEDDHHVAMITRICLEKIGGHQVDWAEDGEKALALILGGPHDLIILDGMMPKKEGLQVAREARAAGVETPIIFLSAKSDDKEFLKIGTGFISKPFEPTGICAAIDNILKNAGVAIG